jgi:heparanase 1
MARGLDPKIVLVGPASAVWPGIGEPNPIIRTLCASSAAEYLDAVSWHWYPQQSSHGRVATRRAREGNMLDARRLDEAARCAGRVDTSLALAARRRLSGKPPENWVTETANALYGGEPGLSDTFVSTLWWLDELGLLARQGVAKVFRQALVGARYGLLDQHSMDPRPDYFASFLWKKLMGRQVLAFTPGASAGRKLRLYAHADKAVPAAPRTVLAINTSRRTTVTLCAEIAAPFKKADRYLLQGDGSFASRTLLVNGIRAGDDLVFGWGKKAVRGKYRIAADSSSTGVGSGGVIEADLPPLSALFIRFR